MTLGVRAALAAAVLFVEKAGLNLCVDFARAQTAVGLGATVRNIQHWGFRLLVSIAVALAVFACLRGGSRLVQANGAARGTRVRVQWLLVHALLVLALVPLSMALYGPTHGPPFGVVVALWIVVAVLATLALLAGLAPRVLWQRGAQALGDLWLYSVLTGAAAVIAMHWSQELWTKSARVTFECVRPLLTWLVPGLRVDPATLVIDTGRFGVEITPVCSGLEGVTLTLAFCIALLVLFRREYIFPRALLLIPLGLALSFALNILRIAALILIGDRGYPEIAVYGFHSQAGWLAFNGVSAAIAFVSLRSRWLSRATLADSAATENPSAVYLLPFLTLVLAGMLSRAASSAGFQPLDSLRLLALGVALAYSFPKLRSLDWRCSWRAPLAGILVSGLWLLAAQLLQRPTALPPGLAALPPPSRALWIAGHMAVSIVTVPVAEELAFRGYLLRRIRSREFDSLQPGSAGLWPLLASSLVFGVCHGALWLPGSIAGLTFGGLYMRTGRLSEAMVSHASANAVLVACALLKPV
jgi:exosortase E/protease (VPEID-CTERM system)